MRRAPPRSGRSGSQGYGQWPTWKSSAQYTNQAMERFRGRRLVLHQRDPDVARTRIAAVGLVAREITARHHAKPCFAPQPQRDRLITAMLRDVEPQQETAGWPAIAITAAENLVGEVKLHLIEPLVLHDMGLVRIGGDRHPLCRQRHLRGGDIAQLKEGTEEAAVARHEAHPQTRQVRALRQRLKDDYVPKIRACLFERARGWSLGIDLRIALVAEQNEAVAAGEPNEPCEIVRVGH